MLFVLKWTFLSALPDRTMVLADTLQAVFSESRPLLLDGSRLGEAVALFEDLPVVIALGANCVAPGITTELLGSLRSLVSNRLIVVYPNSGAQYDAGRDGWYGDEAPAAWASRARDWYLAGADIIGGCCRVGPDHIRQLAASRTWHC